MFAADVHVGRVGGLGERTAEHQKAVLQAFERVVDLAVAEADVLVIAGDLIDREAVWGTYIEQAVAVLQGALERAPELRVVIVAGNHDPARVYRRPEWRALGDERVFIAVEPQVLEAEQLGVDVSVVALPWADGEALSWDRWPDGPTVVAAHACFPPPQGARGKNCVLTPEEAGRWPVSFVGMGHYHRTGEHRAGDVPVVMVGAPEIMDLGHAGRGQVAIVRVAGEGPAEYEMVQTGRLVGLGIETVQWQELAEPRIQALRKYVQERAGQDVVWRLRIEGITDRPLGEALVQIADELGDEFFFFDLQDRTEPMAELAAGGPLIERVVEIAQQRAEKAEQAAEEAKQRGDPQAERKYRDEARALREAAALVVHLLTSTGEGQ